MSGVNVALFSPPPLPPPLPNVGALDECAVVAIDAAIDTDALLETARVELNRNVFVPPAKEDFGEPNEALIPKPTIWLLVPKGSFASCIYPMSSTTRETSCGNAVYVELGQLTFCCTYKN